MCAPALANTQRREGGLKKYFRGGLATGVGMLGHTTPNSSFVLVFCTFSYDSTFLCKIALCYTLLHYNSFYYDSN